MLTEFRISLYYRTTLDGSLSYKHETLEGSKKIMDRLTILCCNMAGTEKKVVGNWKACKTKMFKNTKMKNLSVSCLTNKNVQMIAAIFTLWLKD